MKSCITCPFFKPNPNSHHGFGTCRLNPPAINGSQRWPEVHACNDFCGSHPEFNVVNKEAVKD